MPIKLFAIALGDSTGEQELNAFLSSRKVLCVERHFVNQGPASFWTFCVDYLESSPVSAAPVASKKGKVDYKETLSPAEFAEFAKLRDLRKEIAQAEAVPVYTIFTNEQLAEMTRQKVQTKTALESIAGVGDARIEKYGGRFLELLSSCWPASHEANGQSV